MPDDKLTFAKFISAQGITSTAERRDYNPNMDPDGWARNASHWTVTLRRGHKRMAVPFSQGAAHTKEPTACYVLACLASDASSIENARGFLDWAEEYGYNTDSRKAERSYKATAATTKKLRRFLGEALYHVLLWETDHE